MKYNEEVKETNDENKQLGKDKAFYSDELKKINTYNDPSGLTFE